MQTPSATLLIAALNLLIGCATGWFARGALRSRLRGSADPVENRQSQLTKDCAHILRDLENDVHEHTSALGRFKNVMGAQSNDQQQQDPTAIQTQIEEYSAAGQQFEQVLQEQSGVLSEFRDTECLDLRAIPECLADHSAEIRRVRKFLERKTQDEVLNIAAQLVVQTEDLQEKNARLEAELEGALERIALQENRLSSAEDQALHDPLTQLQNRRAFEEKLNELCALYERMGQPFSIIILDLDHFKKLNDTYGHAAGDAVLKVVARVLTDSIRPFDLAARYGGGGFALLIPQTALGEAARVAERLRVQLEQSEVIHEGQIINVTASLGVAMIEKGESERDVVQRADQALYTAKTRGRNRMVSSDSINPEGIAEPVPVDV